MKISGLLIVIGAVILLMGMIGVSAVSLQIEQPNNGKPYVYNAFPSDTNPNTPSTIDSLTLTAWFQMFEPTYTYNGVTIPSMVASYIINGIGASASEIGSNSTGTFWNYTVTLTLSGSTGSILFSWGASWINDNGVSVSGAYSYTVYWQLKSTSTSSTPPSYQASSPSGSSSNPTTYSTSGNYVWIHMFIPSLSSITSMSINGVTVQPQQYSSNSQGVYSNYSTYLVLTTSGSILFVWSYTYMSNGASQTGQSSATYYYTAPVTPPPPTHGITISISANKGTSIAVNTPIVFTATITYSSGNNIITFYQNGVKEQSGSFTSFGTAFSTAGTYIINATVIDNMGNSNTSNIITETVSGTVSSLSISISSSLNPATVGTSVTFTASISGSSGGNTITFYQNSSVVQSSTLTTYTTSFDGMGSYTISATVTDSSSQTASSNVLTEQVTSTTNTTKNTSTSIGGYVLIGGIANPNKLNVTVNSTLSIIFYPTSGTSSIYIVQLEVVTTGGQTIWVPMNHNNNGTYNSNYVPSTKGTYTLNVFANTTSTTHEIHSTTLNVGKASNIFTPYAIILMIVGLLVIFVGVALWKEVGV